MAIAPGDDILAADVLSVVGVPICKLRQGVVQSISSASITKLTFASSSEDSDVLGWHDTSVNNTRITPDRTGWYEVGIINIWQFNTTMQYSDVRIYKNNVAIEAAGNLQFPPAAGQNNVSKFGGNIILPLTVDVVGDYFEAAVLHVSDSAAAKNTNAGIGSNSAPRFWVRYLGPL